LKDHILGRLLGQEYTGDSCFFTPNERNTIKIVNNSLYSHKVLRVNYTTYDLRRAQDTLNLTTHRDFMTLSHDDDDHNLHPYWYGRIIGIYHVQVIHVGEKAKSQDPQTLQVLHVRWFGTVADRPAGWNAKRLHRIGFLDETEPLAFGFLDPAEVIREVHLVPAFAEGRTTKRLGPSALGRPKSDNDEDWENFYVEM
jgi:hypothetical protein